jgi:DNA mismatch repair ATPase MutS
LNGIYLLDVCRTAQRIAQERKYCCTPTILETGNCIIQGFQHPFIKDAQKNDWQLTRGNIAIFTGSNMAGKSTTLKALASTIWLAQCGLPVPADSMIIPIYDAIYTSINLPDSLRDGRSHFMAEVIRIKEVLTQARTGMRCLIILDEMFRGTNARDAYEASVAVNQLLLEYPNCHFLISTHILEYDKHFEDHPACQFYYMESKIKDDRFICSYKLKEGISESKVGYWIIRKELKI